MKPQHYYIERPHFGVFAIVEVELLELVKSHPEADENLYIRPMHDEENWDTTIQHESMADKTYCTIDDTEDIETFLNH